MFAIVPLPCVEIDSGLAVAHLVFVRPHELAIRETAYIPVGGRLRHIRRGGCAHHATPLPSHQLYVGRILWSASSGLHSWRIHPLACPFALSRGVRRGVSSRFQCASPLLPVSDLFHRCALLTACRGRTNSDSLVYCEAERPNQAMERTADRRTLYFLR